jgi:hypothetical protein
VGVAAAAVASSVSRRVDARDASVFVGVLAATIGLAAANGGYFPGSWGWASLGFAWAAALALLVRRALALTRLELTMIGALAGLALWYLLSTLWSTSVPSSAFETERALVFPAGVAAVLLVARGRSVSALAGALLAAIALVDLYALATRLFPDRIGTFDSIAAYRLQTPIGYWNGLGVFSVVGLLLALGVVARERRIVARALAGLVVPPVAATLYFTFSRGALIALAVALVVAVVVDPRRLQLLAVALPLAAPAALGVWLASRKTTLSTIGATVSAAAHDGHRLAAVIALLSLAAALVATGAALAERRVRVPSRARVAFAAAVAAAAVAVVAAGLVHYGGPAHAARQAWHSFTAPPVKTNGSLNKRLFSFSSNGRIDLWHAAWTETKAHPWLGGGAGSYEQWWNVHRPNGQKVRDAHSLYLETLAELGPVGLGLLVLALALPLVGAVRARVHPLVPALAGAYVAFLLHAVADWDWELSGVTLTGLLCGAGILLAARGDRPETEPRRPLRLAAVTGAVVVGAASVVILLGNTQLARSEAAARAGNPTKAIAQARSAARWMPWSSEPWRLRAEAEIASGFRAAARRSLATAIDKDPRDWRLWLDLARASEGARQRLALGRALRLNPLAPALRQFEAEFGVEPLFRRG